MTKLSVNINKIATIRNARGGKQGKAAEAEAKPEEIDAPETSRMFAMKDGKIVFNGVEQNNKEE